MEREPSNNKAERRRSSVRISAKQLLKDVPPVAVLSLTGINSYEVKDEADVIRFTKGLKLNDAWVNKADDDRAPVIPLLSEGLIVAVEYFCNSLPNVHFESFGTETGMEKHLKVILYRSVCELVDNALRHSSCTHVFVQVMTENNYISVTVHDDGGGFDPETATIGTGLGNIATAVIACNGKIGIYSSSKGTEINIDIE